jgi:hypothetical protein
LSGRTFGKEKTMDTRLNLGLCYRVVFKDGSSMQFRYLGADAGGMPIIQSPPDQGERKVLERTDVKDLYEIDVPREEMEAVRI